MDDNWSNDPQVDAVAARLNRKFAGDDGPLPEDEVVEVVREAAESLRDAPVQTFVPIITENLARNELQERVADDAREEPEAPI